MAMVTPPHLCHSKSSPSLASSNDSNIPRMAVITADNAATRRSITNQSSLVARPDGIHMVKNEINSNTMGK